MEYLMVLFVESRGVRIDGLVQGWTNVVLQLEAGDHDVTLEPPSDYSPVSQHVVLQNTAALDPCKVTFHRLPPAARLPLPRRPA